MNLHEIATEHKEWFEDVRQHLADQGISLDDEGFILNRFGERNVDGWMRRPGARNPARRTVRLTVNAGREQREQSRLLREACQDRPPLTHVACKDTEGRIWSMPAPFRHHHVLRVMHEHGAKHAEGNHINQGFLDESGRYLNRKDAHVNASLHDQIKNGQIIGGVLTSEDLW